LAEIGEIRYFKILRLPAALCSVETVDGASIVILVASEVAARARVGGVGARFVLLRGIREERDGFAILGTRPIRISVSISKGRPETIF
jgi:hypothetical protein